MSNIEQIKSGVTANALIEIQAFCASIDSPESNKIAQYVAAIADELSRAREHCKECEQSNIEAEESRDNLTAQIDKIHHTVLSSEATLPSTYSVSGKVQALVDEHRNLLTQIRTYQETFAALIALEAGIYQVRPCPSKIPEITLLAPGELHQDYVDAAALRDGFLAAIAAANVPLSDHWNEEPPLVVLQQAIAALKVDAMTQSSRLVGAYKNDVTAWRRSLTMLLESLLDADLQDKDAIAKAVLRQVERGV